MPSMKNTVCKICGINLTKKSYADQTEHILFHEKQELERKSQTTLD